MIKVLIRHPLELLSGSAVLDGDLGNASVDAAHFRLLLQRFFGSIVFIVNFLLRLYTFGSRCSVFRFLPNLIFCSILVKGSQGLTVLALLRPLSRSTFWHNGSLKSRCLKTICNWLSGHVTFSNQLKSIKVNTIDNLI